MHQISNGDEPANREEMARRLGSTEAADQLVREIQQHTSYGFPGAFNIARDASPREIEVAMRSGDPRKIEALARRYG